MQEVLKYQRGILSFIDRTLLTISLKARAPYSIWLSWLLRTSYNYTQMPWPLRVYTYRRFSARHSSGSIGKKLKTWSSKTWHKWQSTETSPGTVVKLQEGHRANSIQPSLPSDVICNSWFLRKIVTPSTLRCSFSKLWLYTTAPGPISETYRLTYLFSFDATNWFARKPK